MLLLIPFLCLCGWRVLGGRSGSGRRNRLLDVAAVGGAFLCCWPAVSWLLVASLEKQFPVERFPGREAQAIVVLAGTAYPVNASQPEAEPGQSTYLRCAHAAWLFHHWSRLPIVVSGGAVAPGDPLLAGLMRRQLLEEGVPDAMIRMEGRSANTDQNARETARILLPKGLRRIALVTEALHMPRAAACFRKQGFDVVPAACSYHLLEFRSLRDFLMPQSRAIHLNEDSLHEWIGLAWYKIRGWI